MSRSRVPLRRLIVCACLVLGMVAVWWSGETQRSVADASNGEEAVAADLGTLLYDQAFSMMGYRIAGNPAALALYERQEDTLAAHLREARERPGWQSGEVARLVERQSRLFERWREVAGTGTEREPGTLDLAEFWRAFGIFTQYRSVNEDLVAALDQRQRADQRRAELIGIGSVWAVLLVGLVAFLLVDAAATRASRERAALARLADRVQRARTEDEAHSVLGAELDRWISGASVRVVDPGEPAEGARYPAFVGGEEVAALVVNTERPLSARQSYLVADAAARCAPILATLRTLAGAEHRASTDYLTGLPNARATHEALARMAAAAERSGAPLAVALLDIDRFKRVNDRFGHAIGDEVLAAVGAAVARAIRASDLAGRVGGEEFLILMPDTDYDGGIEAAERIREAVSEVQVEGLDHDVTCCLGTAVYPSDAAGPAELLRRADQAMYAAKAAGRDRVVAASGQPCAVSPSSD